MLDWAKDELCWASCRLENEAPKTSIRLMWLICCNEGQKHFRSQSINQKSVGSKPFLLCQSVLTWTNLNKSSPRRCLIGGVSVDDGWFGAVESAVGAPAVELCGWRLGGSTGVLGSSTPVKLESCTWTSASGWTVGRAWGSGWRGACRLLAWLWLKQQNRQFQHPISTTILYVLYVTTKMLM